MAERQEPEFGFWKSVIFSLVLVGAVLGSAELAVRGWAYFLRDDSEKFDLETGTFVLVPGRHRSPQGVVEVNSQGFVGEELRPEGPDLWRIASVGDSCTFGGGSERHSYPGKLQTLLDERAGPGRRYDAVNAGISGLDSGLALRRLRTRVIPLEPDVVTIYVGWNDLMKVNPMGQGGESWLSEAARALDRLWLVKGMRKLAFMYLRPHLRPPRVGPESRTGRFADFRPLPYEENLRSMISTARGAGAAPVLLTLPTVVRMEMTADELRDAGVFFPWYPSAYAVGDFLDLVAAYNRSIVRLAEAEKVPLVDLASHFAELSDPRPFFFDTMHPTERGLRLIAETLLAGLDGYGLLGPPVAAHHAGPR
jgi:lysophospholipase L1-like esterase